MANKLLVPVFALLAIIFGAYLFFVAPNLSEGPPPPVETADDEWSGSATTTQGLLFTYPDELPTTYISTAEWPPRVEVVVNEYTCSTDVTGTDGPPVTIEERTIQGRDYCIGTWSEGAAGSTFVTYEYATDRRDAILRTYFTLRFVQCANYDEPNKSSCEAERAAFSPDTLAGRIIESVVLP